MAEEKKEPWLNYLALTMVILAVCATLATFRSGGYSTRSVMSQTQASDQWAYFQAKSIKGYIYEMQKEQYELTLKGLSGKEAQATVADYKKKIAEYRKIIARYDLEKAQIQKDAKAFEAVRDDAKNHGQAFGIAVIFLQIAILLASIAALMKKKPLWFLSMAVGLEGLFALSMASFFSCSRITEMVHALPVMGDCHSTRRRVRNGAGIRLSQ